MDSAVKKMTTGLIVVHGIGEQAHSRTLLTWAEPLLKSLRDSAAVGEVIEVENVATPNNTDGPGVTLTVRRDGKARARIEMVEARWAEAFPTLSPLEVVTWAIRFSFGAFGHVARHRWRFARAQLEPGMRAIEAALEPSDDSTRVAGTDPERETASEWFGRRTMVPTLIAFWFVPLLAAASEVITSVIIIGLLPLAIALGLVVLLAAAILSVVPGIRVRVSRVMQLLTNYGGDAAAWGSRPLRAAAMRDVVRREIRAMRERADTVIVIAHSQGAAVAALAVLPRNGTPVDVFVTVGGAVALLKTAAPDGQYEWAPLDAWQAPHARHIRWINIWSIRDPVPSGPVASDRHESMHLWERAMTPQSGTSPPVDEPANDPYGPEEWAVDNMSSALGDHFRYTTNRPQVIDRIAKLVRNPGHQFESRSSRGSPAAAQEFHHAGLGLRLSVGRNLCVLFGGLLSLEYADASWAVTARAWLASTVREYASPLPGWLVESVAFSILVAGVIGALGVVLRLFWACEHKLSKGLGLTGQAALAVAVMALILRPLNQDWIDATFAGVAAGSVLAGAVWACAYSTAAERPRDLPARRHAAEGRTHRG